MNMADRIQFLRKTRGISQEEPADQIGVSRQAVSKWESEQSIPELEKVIVISDYFGVTTDYLLKGTEPMEDKDYEMKSIGSNVLYLLSTAFMAIGIFSGLGSWYEKQSLADLGGALIIQCMGLVLYFTGKYLSDEKPHFYTKWLNVLELTFMPTSMISGFITQRIFKKGRVAPFPNEMIHILLFSMSFLTIAALSYVLIKKRERKER